MRGVDLFREPEWAETYDNRVVEFKNRQERTQGRNFTTQPMTEGEYSVLYHDVRHRYRLWQQQQVNEAREREVDYSHLPELDTDKLPNAFPGRPALPPFKLPYDTIEEVRMRLRQTVIFIKNHPFIVHDCQTNRKNPDVDGRFKLVLEDRDLKQSIIPLDKATDLRGCPPSYVVRDGQVGYLNRIPARVNTQGMTPQNTTIRRVGTYGGLQFNLRSLVQFCAPRKAVKWSESLSELIVNDALREVRLDSNVAIFAKPSTEKLYAEYKGRRIGEIKEQTVIPDDPDDLVQPWIVDDLRTVNLELRGGNV
jgi:hypothetical protein